MLQLFCDTNTELPWELAERYGVEVIRMPYVLKDEEYYYDLGKHTDFKKFFNDVRAGNMPLTAALNPLDYRNYFEPVLKRGDDILHIAFSSQLSGTINNLMAAREELLGEYPERKITVVDTLCISKGGALLVYGALQMWKQGKTAEEIVAYVENNRMKVNHWFVVEDLNHLKRGGRLSSTAAAIGTMLALKPMLTVNREGKVVVAEKLKGRKNSLKALVEKVQANLPEAAENPICILHADDDEACAYLVEQINALCQPKELWIGYIGPVIGTHCGPGTMAVCFMGAERTL